MLRILLLFGIVFQLLRVDSAWRAAQRELLPGYRGLKRSANPEHYTPVGRQHLRRWRRAWITGLVATLLVVLLVSVGVV